VANPADLDAILPLTVVMVILMAFDGKVNRTIVLATMHLGVMGTPATQVLLVRNVVRQVASLDVATTAAIVNVNDFFAKSKKACLGVPFCFYGVIVLLGAFKNSEFAQIPRVKRICEHLLLASFSYRNSSESNRLIRQTVWQIARIAGFLEVCCCADSRYPLCLPPFILKI
jgi:hypothetical protein